MKTIRNIRQYAVFDSQTGFLVGNLLWANVLGIYSGSPHSVVAVYCRRNGKPQVRWICTGLDAGARENHTELDRLDGQRKKSGFPFNQYFTVHI
jgi:hypothetical protein